jgi:hypothetical protein
VCDQRLCKTARESIIIFIIIGFFFQWELAKAQVFVLVDIYFGFILTLRLWWNENSRIQSNIY